MIRPEFKDRDDYGDAHDLLVSWDLEHWLKIECKGRLLSFPPFKYKTLFVDRVDKIDRDPADLYVNLNKQQTHIAIIGIDTREHWSGPNRVWDRVKRYPVTVMECPIELVRFVSIEHIAISKEAA